MCGIAGHIDFAQFAEQGQIVLAEMLQSIEHRGPDARGQFEVSPSVFLGHNRLSIIDLSDDSNQPMIRGDLALVFNGEIYNYLEIREELIGQGVQFKTESDTEVIIESYKKWGRDCVNRFVGMWAFAIWDDAKRELFCSRDRFGIKPFYYIHKDGAFYFASEMKALKKSRLFQNRYNERVVLKALHLGPFGADSETHFEDIKSLVSAHNAIFKDGQLTTSRYWDIDFSNQCTLKFQADRIEKFKELFIDSINLHMRSDVEVGGCLSGGLDSGAIASVVGQKYPDVNFRTFNIFYEGSGASDVDERPWVNQITDKYPTLKPHFLSPTDEDLINAFDRFAYHQDVPVSGSSPLSGYFVMRLAAEHGIKVLLNGQGSDEYLAGYMHAFYRLIGTSLSRFNIPESISRMAHHSKDQGLGAKDKVALLARSLYSSITDEQGMAVGQLKRKFAYLSSSIAPDSLVNYPSLGQSRFTEYLYHATFSSTLPTLLHYEDRNSMAFSIESRVPFLDHRLVEYAFSLPDQDKIYQGKTKYVLRESMRDFLPSAIKNRKDKKGFVTPGEVKWLRGPLKHLTEINPDGLPMLDPNKTSKVLNAYNAGDNSNAKLVWRLATLNHWMKNNGFI